MLISNLEILNAVLSGTDESNPTKVYYSGSDTYDALGRGERIVLQLVVDSASLPANGVKKVIVNMERSNDGKVWEAGPEAKTDVTLTPASTLPTSKFLDTGNVDFILLDQSYINKLRAYVLSKGLMDAAEAEEIFLTSDEEDVAGTAFRAGWDWAAPPPSSLE